MNNTASQNIPGSGLTIVPWYNAAPEDGKKPAKILAMHGLSYVGGDFERGKNYYDQPHNGYHHISKPQHADYGQVQKGIACAESTATLGVDGDDMPKFRATQIYAWADIYGIDATSTRTDGRRVKYVLVDDIGHFTGRWPQHSAGNAEAAARGYDMLSAGLCAMGTHYSGAEYNYDNEPILLSQLEPSALHDLVEALEEDGIKFGARQAVTTAAFSGDITDFLGQFPRADEGMSDAYKALEWQPGEGNGALLGKCRTLLDLAADGHSGALTAWTTYLANSHDTVRTKRDGETHAEHAMGKVIPDWQDQRAKREDYDSYWGNFPQAAAKTHAESSTTTNPDEEKANYFDPPTATASTTTAPAQDDWDDWGNAGPVPLPTMLTANGDVINVGLVKFVAKGTLGLISAKGGQGKSFVAREMCGQEFRAGGMALYIDLETSKERFKAQALKHGIKPGQVKRTSKIEKNGAALGEKCRENGITLVVIDALAGFLPFIATDRSDSEFSPQTMEKVHRWARAVIAESGATVVLIDHHNSKDEIYGGDNGRKVTMSDWHLCSREKDNRKFSVDKSGYSVFTFDRDKSGISDGKSVYLWVAGEDVETVNRAMALKDSFTRYPVEKAEGGGYRPVLRTWAPGQALPEISLIPPRWEKVITAIAEREFCTVGALCQHMEIYGGESIAAESWKRIIREMTEAGVLAKPVQVKGEGRTPFKMGGKAAPEYVAVYETRAALVRAMAEFFADPDEADEDEDEADEGGQESSS